MTNEEMIKVLQNIKRSSELLFEHYKFKGFKNRLIEIGIQNIIDMCKMALEEMDEGKKEERDNLTEKNQGRQLS
jgi:uncharacterized protein YutE (UPF0331/DUF86 family)